MLVLRSGMMNHSEARGILLAGSVFNIWCKLFMACRREKFANGEQDGCTSSCCCFSLLTISRFVMTVVHTFCLLAILWFAVLLAVQSLVVHLMWHGHQLAEGVAILQNADQVRMPPSGQNHCTLGWNQHRRTHACIFAYLKHYAGIPLLHSLLQVRVAEQLTKSVPMQAAQAFTGDTSTWLQGREEDLSTVIFNMNGYCSRVQCGTTIATAMETLETLRQDTSEISAALEVQDRAACPAVGCLNLQFIWFLKGSTCLCNQDGIAKLSEETREGANPKRGKNATSECRL